MDKKKKNIKHPFAEVLIITSVSRTGGRGKLSNGGGICAVYTPNNRRRPEAPMTALFTPVKTWREGKEGTRGTHEM